MQTTGSRTNPSRSVAPKRMRRRLITWVIGLVVALALAQAVRHAFGELEKQRSASLVQLESIEQKLFEPGLAPNQRAELESQKQRLIKHRDEFWSVRWRELGLALAFYAMGTSFAGLYWIGTLHRFGQMVPWWQTFRIYFFGHLAKYVPGKAMVLVVRVGMLRRFGAAMFPATVSVFMETLNWLAVGAALSGFVLMLWQQRVEFIALVIASFVIAASPTIPPLFNFGLAILVRMKLHESLSEHSIRMTWSHFWFGWLVLLPGWLCVGASLLFVIRALPAAETSVSLGPLYLGCVGVVAVASIAGFVSFLPGGAGVRELVIMMLLEPIVGGPIALVAAIWLRLVALLTELLLAGVMAPFPNLGLAESDVKSSP